MLLLLLLLLQDLPRHSAALRLAHLPIHAQTGRDHAAHIAHIAGDDDGGALAGQLRKGIDVLLGDAQAHGALGGSAPLVDATAHGVDAPGGGFGLEEDGLGLAVGAIDLLGAQGLGRQDDALLLALGDVDGALALALGVEDLGALRPLRCHLPVHGGHDGLGRVDVPDLVPQARHAPCLRRFVDRRRDVGVERGSLFQYVVEGQLADFAAHCGLGELRDGVLGVFNSIAVWGVRRDVSMKKRQTEYEERRKR